MRDLATQSHLIAPSVDVDMALARPDAWTGSCALRVTVPDKDVMGLRA